MPVCVFVCVRVRVCVCVCVCVWKRVRVKQIFGLLECFFHATKSLHLNNLCSHKKMLDIRSRSQYYKRLVETSLMLYYFNKIVNKSSTCTVKELRIDIGLIQGNFSCIGLALGKKWIFLRRRSKFVPFKSLVISLLHLLILLSFDKYWIKIEKKLWLKCNYGSDKCLKIEIFWLYKFLKYKFALQSWVNDHLQIATTCLQRRPFWGPILNFHNIKLPMNNDLLSTATNLGYKK